jgi:hypothetical protein
MKNPMIVKPMATGTSISSRWKTKVIRPTVDHRPRQSRRRGDLTC